MTNKFLLTLPFGGCDWTLLPEKAIFQEKRNWLVVSDLHFGKARHFQRSGIAVPSGMTISDLERLDSLISTFSPKRVVILGDLFHSEENRDWAVFKKFRMTHGETIFTLVMGNHDILERDRYLDLGLEVVDRIIEPGFSMAHDPDDANEGPVISGHLHPGIRLNGMARQSMKLPCFHVSRNRFILPAFGRFTGTALIRPKKEDRVVAISGGDLIPL